MADDIRWVRSWCSFPKWWAGADIRAKFMKSPLTAGSGRVKIIPIPPMTPTPAHCKHPQVRVVARDEDTEFVECLSCGEVFDSIEYRDMVLEEEESLLRENESA
jgi:hypothetical protein